MAELNQLETLVYTRFDLYGAAGSCPKALHEKFLHDTQALPIVIINLIANLPFLYHKPEKDAVTRID